MATVARQADIRIPQSDIINIAKDLKTLGIVNDTQISLFQSDSMGGAVLADTANQFLTNSVKEFLSTGQTPNLAAFSNTMVTTGFVALAIEIYARVSAYEKVKENFDTQNPNSIPRKISTDYAKLRTNLEYYLTNSPNLNKIYNYIKSPDYSYYDPYNALFRDDIYWYNKLPTPWIPEVYLAVDRQAPLRIQIETAFVKNNIQTLSKSQQDKWVQNMASSFFPKPKPIPAELQTPFTEGEFWAIVDVINNLYVKNTPYIHLTKANNYINEADQLVNIFLGKSINILNQEALPNYQAVYSEFAKFSQITLIIIRKANELKTEQQKIDLMHPKTLLDWIVWLTINPLTPP